MLFPDFTCQVEEHQIYNLAAPHPPISPCFYMNRALVTRKILGIKITSRRYAGIAPERGVQYSLYNSQLALYVNGQQWAHSITSSDDRIATCLDYSMYMYCRLIYYCIRHNSLHTIYMYDYVLFNKYINLHTQNKQHTIHSNQQRHKMNKLKYCVCVKNYKYYCAIRVPPLVVYKASTGGFEVLNKFSRFAGLLLP